MPSADIVEIMDLEAHVIQPLLRRAGHKDGVVISRHFSPIASHEGHHGTPRRYRWDDAIGNEHAQMRLEPGLSSRLINKVQSCVAKSLHVCGTTAGARRPIGTQDLTAKIETGTFRNLKGLYALDAMDNLDAEPFRSRESDPLPATRLRNRLDGACACQVREPAQIIGAGGAKSDRSETRDLCAFRYMDIRRVTRAPHVEAFGGLCRDLHPKIQKERLHRVQVWRAQPHILNVDDICRGTHALSSPVTWRGHRRPARSSPVSSSLGNEIFSKKDTVNHYSSNFR